MSYNINPISIKFNTEDFYDQAEIKNVNFKSVSEFIPRLNKLFISHSNLKSLNLTNCTNKNLLLDSIKDLPIDSLLILDEKVKESINIGIKNLKKLQISMIEGCITFSECFRNLEGVYIESPSDINNIEYLETSSGLTILYITTKGKTSGTLGINYFPLLKSLTLENVSVRDQEISDLQKLHQLLITDSNIKRIYNLPASLTTLKVIDDCLEEIDIKGENLYSVYIRSYNLKKLNLEGINQEDLIQNKGILPKGTARKGVISYQKKF